MTTPAQDAPLVFPAVAFNPARLSTICVLLAGLVTAVAALLGHVMFGVFFGVGLALGLLNALLVRRAVSAITAQDHPLKKKMALNSATRLLAITAVGLTIAFLFKPMGLGRVVRSRYFSGDSRTEHVAAGNEEAARGCRWRNQARHPIQRRMSTKGLIR